MAYIDSIHSAKKGFESICGFGNTFLCNGEISQNKTVTFPNGWDNDTNLSFKVIFEEGHNCADDSTHMTLNNIAVVVNQHGTLIPLPIHTFVESGTPVYKSLQPNTVLEMYYTDNYDGDNTPAFVVVGNPIVLSSADYTIYANGQNGYELNKTIPDVKLFSNYYCRVPPASVANTKYTFTATEDCFIRISQSWDNRTNTGKAMELFSSNDISLTQVKYAGYGGSSITTTDDNDATLKSNWLFVRKGESVKYVYYGYDNEIYNPRIAMLTQKQTSNPLFVNN